MNYIAMLLLVHVPDEQDAFWCLVHVMFDRGWREIYKKNKSKSEKILKDLDSHLKKKFPDLHQRFEHSEYLSIEATFTTHIMSLYIYDARLDIATHLFEIFLVEGHQVIVDLCASLIEAQYKDIMRYDDLQLMNFLRKDMIQRGF